jgi:hypothetical protein
MGKGTNIGTRPGEAEIEPVSRILSSSFALPGPIRAPDSKTMLILIRAMSSLCHGIGQRSRGRHAHCSRRAHRHSRGGGRGGVQSLLARVDFGAARNYAPAVHIAGSSRCSRPNRFVAKTIEGAVIAWPE